MQDKLKTTQDLMTCPMWVVIQIRQQE